MPSRRYLALQAEYNHKSDELSEYLKGANGDYASIDAATAEAKERELDALDVQIREHARLEDLEVRHTKAADERRQLLKPMVHYAGGSGGPSSISDKSLGELFKDAYPKRQGKAFDQELVLDLKSWLEQETKASFLTSAGWLPESRRTGQVIPDAVAPIQILDIFPVRQTETPTPVYMEETLVTNAAAEIAEAGPYQESALALTPRTVTVRKIGTHLPASDEILEDVTEAAAYIDGRLRYFCRRRLESQILLGDGIAPNLLGILNTVGIQTQAIGAEDRLQAIYRGIAKVRTIGMANPDVVLMHPGDWDDIKVLKDPTTGQFIWGHPSITGPDTIWGLRVVLNTLLTVGTALILDTTFTQIYLRHAVQVETGWIASQFTSGMQTIRANIRAGFALLRPESACTVTGI